VSYACRVIDHKGGRLLIEHIDLDYAPASYLSIHRNFGLGHTIWAQYPIDVSAEEHSITLIQGNDAKVLVDGKELPLVVTHR
jgi:hypothetical protein